MVENFKTHPRTDMLAEHRIPGAPGSLISEGKHGFLVGCFWAKVPQLPDHGFRSPGGVGQKNRYGSVPKWSGPQLGLVSGWFRSLPGPNGGFWFKNHEISPKLFFDIENIYLYFQCSSGLGGGTSMSFHINYNFKKIV